MNASKDHAKKQARLCQGSFTHIKSPNQHFLAVTKRHNFFQFPRIAAVAAMLYIYMTHIICTLHQDAEVDGPQAALRRCDL
jgi:hypothetical protein